MSLKRQKATGAPSDPGLKWRILRGARRCVQVFFLLLFLWLIGRSASATGAVHDAVSSTSVSYPVEFFLNIDPFVGIMVLLSTGTVPGAVLWGLVTLISGFFLGRAFCGWVCPMGTLNHIFAETKPTLKGSRRIKANKTRPYQKVKYLILTGAAAAALFGSAVGGLLDPLCLATRGIALTVLPIAEWCVRTAIGAAARSDIGALQFMADGLSDLADTGFFNGEGTLVEGGVVLSVVFIAVLAVNRFIPRFWCRGLCPLGALLGLSGRFGLFTLRKDESSCTNCKKCELSCQGAASPLPGEPWRRSECDFCMNCTAACTKSHSLSFGLSGYITNEKASLDIRRRHLLTGAAAGAALVPTLRTGVLNSADGRPSPSRIRPPGSLNEKEFLSRCIRCGQCMKICPNNALHPALEESGVEGLWTPVLIPKIGYCEPTCTLCSQVCPTGAIRPVRENEKNGSEGEKLLKIGTAFIDRGRCLPWAMNTPCIVCEEFCPASPKAIVIDEAPARGSSVVLKRPVIRPDRCTGCGACEHVCPVNDKAAIRISCVGESRDPSNTLLQEKRSTKAD